MKAGFELFDHTADLGIRIFAPTRVSLPWPAVQGLYAAIGELVAEPSQTQPLRFEEWMISGFDSAVLLRDFLQSALLHFERDQKIITRVECGEFSDTHLKAEVHLADLSAAQSIFHREVKAVTYHELSLVETDGGYEARVIVDI